MSHQNYSMTLNRTLLVILLAFFLPASVQAQTAAAKSTAQAAEGPGPDSKAAQSLTQALETYKTDLANLAASYDADLKKLGDRNAELKQMLAQGYVSRLEVEQSDKAVAEAQTRIEQIRRQIAAADSTVPQDVLADTAGPHQWATGNANIDSLIRRYASLYGVDPYLVYCVIRQE